MAKPKRMVLPRWTVKRAAAASKRNIKAARKAFLNIAYQWGDENQYLVNRIDEMLEELDTLENEIAEYVNEVSEESHE